MKTPLKLFLPLLLLFSMAANMAGQVPSSVLAGLKIYYPLDDDTVAEDTVMDGSDAAGPFDATKMNGGPITGVAGVFGQGAEFAGGPNNGENPYLSLDAHSEALAGYSEGTLAAWVNISPDLTTDVLTIFAASDAGAGSVEARFYISDAGELAYGARGNSTSGGVSTSGADLVDGTWHHVAATVTDAGEVTLYVDGTEAASGNVGFLSGLSALNSASVGRNKDSTPGGGQWFYDGLIDDFALWDRALAANEVQEIFDAGLDGYSLGVTPVPPIVLDGLQVYYPLNEDTIVGTTVADVHQVNGPFSGQLMNGLTGGAAGIYGEGLEFIGALNNENGPYISLDEHAAAFAAFTEGTLSAWVNVSAEGLQTNVLTIFGASDSDEASVEVRFFVTDTGELHYGSRGNSSSGEIETTGAGLLDDTWHHVAATVTSDGTLTMYIDGTNVASGTSGFLAGLSGLNSISVGRNLDSTEGGGQWFYDGLLDDFALWNRALSATEIEQIASAGLPLIVPGLDSTDNDGDGMPNDYESANGLDPDTDDADGDNDSDGLTNLEEYQLQTNPQLADTDNDGLNDGGEVSIGADPFDSDTDDDGVEDGQEVALGSSPFKSDSDDDGIDDAEEIANGTNPASEDSDNDGFIDGLEIARGSNPNDDQDTPDTSGLPPVLDGLWLHLDASAGTESPDGPAGDSGPVTTWIDQSGRGNHAVVVDATVPPVLNTEGPNGMPTIHFDAETGHSFYSIDDLVIPDDHDLTVFAVATSTADGFPTGGSGIKPVFVSGSPDFGNGVIALTGVRGRPGTFGYYGSQANDDFPYTGFTTTGFDQAFHIASVTVDGSHADGAGLYTGRYDGRPAAVPSFPGDTTDALTGPVEIGGTATSTSRRFHGEIAEIILFNRKLSDEEEFAVGAYLQQKYGIDADYIDSDGDGVSDPIELALGSDPNDDQSLPDPSNVYLTASNAPTESWQTAADWSNGEAPTAGTNYFVIGAAATPLRTPEDGSAFAGDSLTLAAGGELLVGPAGGSVPNLILAGGDIGLEGATGTLSGGLTIDEGTIDVGGGGNTLTLAAPTSGDGTVSVTQTGNFDGTATLDLTATNSTFSGTWIITGATTLTATGAGSLGAADVNIENGTFDPNYNINSPNTTLVISNNGFFVLDQDHVFKTLFIGNLNVSDLLGEGPHTFQTILEDLEGQGVTEENLAAFISQGGGSFTVVGSAGDSDEDGLLDQWELDFFGSTAAQDGGGDADGDGLTNAGEFNVGTDPTNADSDGDTLSDGDEVNNHGTSPLAADSDNDNLDDSTEIATTGTDPLNPDSDDDGLEDGAEINDYLTAADNVDSDSDGFNDGLEVRSGSDPNDDGSVPPALLHGIVAYASMDSEDIDGDVVQSLVSGIDGIRTNGGPEVGVAGAVGEAVGFAGAANNEDGQYIDYADNLATLGTLTEGTIATWIRPDGDAPTDVLTIFSVSHGTEGSVEMRWWVSNGGVQGTGTLAYGTRGGAVNATIHSDTDTLFDGEWHHVAVTVDSANNATIYIDGQAEATGTVGFLGNFETLTESAIGRNKDNTAGGGQWFFDGGLDEFAIWSRPLSGAEIEGLYQRGLGGSKLLAPGGTEDDSDGDGIPDDFEIANGLNPEVNDAGGDADNDGMTNLAEYTAGTDPQSASSRFHVSGVSEGPAGVTLTFSTVPGKSYAVEFTESLRTPDWQPVPGTDTIVATGSNTDVLDPGAGTSSTRFYRIIVLD